MTYRVRVTTTAYVEAFTSVEAEDERSAIRAAIQSAQDGDLEWIYDGLTECGEFDGAAQ